MTPLILTPHVSWRRESLIELLEQLDKQTMPVTVVVLHDDTGWARNPPWWPAGLEGRVEPVNPDKAQCDRWKVIENQAGYWTAPILTLDDDMIVDEKYVERTVEQLRQAYFLNRQQPSVLSWGGVNADYRWNHYFDEHEPCELVVPQAGAMAFYASTFVGLNETPLAKKSLVRGGSEETAVAAFLHDKRIPIFRPRGRGPTPHKCAFDKRSSYRTTQGQLRDILKWAETNTSWPHAKPMQILLSGCRPAPYRRHT